MPPELDCRQCGLPLVFVRSDGSLVGYYRCPRCDRLLADTDERALELTAMSAAQQAARREAEERARAWRPLRERLDRFLARAERKDPFAALGLSAGATLAQARERFHELALEHHPDRGGDAERMRALIEAYDQVRDSLARTARAAPPVQASAPKPSGLTRRQPESWSRARGASTKEEMA